MSCFRWKNILIIIIMQCIAAQAIIEARASYPYPISGYFAYYPGANKWAETLDRIQDVGGDKVIHLGQKLEVVIDRKKLPSTKIFEYFVVDGKQIDNYIEDELKKRNPGNSLRYVFTYESPESFSRTLLRSELDLKREIPTYEDKMTTFWALLFSKNSPGASPDFSVGQDFDLVLIAGEKNDSVAELLREANDRKMQVYLGMPCATYDPGAFDDPEDHAVWRVWDKADELALAFTERIFTDYVSRKLDTTTAFIGLYQTFETPVQGSVAMPPVQSAVKLYKRQHALARRILPGKKILLSPYWDARKGIQEGQPPASIKAGFKHLARTGVDIIAPQDSRGTGKVGLFWEYQKNKRVPIQVKERVDYAQTFAEAYYANTQTFYRVCREAVTELVHEGVRVALWANVELFEPESYTDKPACHPEWDDSYLRQTTKKRIDHALTFDGAFVSDQIGFRWDLLQCDNEGVDKPTVEERIHNDWQRPIVVHAFHWSKDRTDGIIIRGYNIITGHVEFTYYDAEGKLRQKIVNVKDGWIDPDFGEDYNNRHADPGFHKYLQEIWLPFDWSDVSTTGDSWLRIHSVNADNQKSHFEYSLPVSPMDASPDGDWTAKRVILRNTTEADLMVRTGDIDNLNFGWPDHYNPFSGRNTPVHPFPWDIDPLDPQGTDRIMVVSSYTGNTPHGNDGYSITTQRPENNVRPITLTWKGYNSFIIKDAVLQIFVDDFQAPVWWADYEVYLDSQRAPFLERIINQLAQTGPIGKILQVNIPLDGARGFKRYLYDGELSLKFDDTTTGAGDGYAIDFVKLLLNTKDLANKGHISGFVLDQHTLEPLENAEVTANASVVDYTDADGKYLLEDVLSGLVTIQTSAEGYGAKLFTVELDSGRTVMRNFRVTSGASRVNRVQPSDGMYVDDFATDIVVEFDSNMDTSSINELSFYIADSISALSGNFIKTANSFVFEPAERLRPDTDYHALLTIDIKNVDGLRLCKDYAWMFTTKTPTSQDKTTDSPYRFHLAQNYPNPFNPLTTIEFQLPKDGEVQLTVYDINGKRVKRLVNCTKSAGHHRVVWNGRNEYGVEVASGTFLYRLTTSDRSATCKLLFLK